MHDYEQTLMNLAVSHSCSPHFAVATEWPGMLQYHSKKICDKAEYPSVNEITINALYFGGWLFLIMSPLVTSEEAELQAV